MAILRALSTASLSSLTRPAWLVCALLVDSDNALIPLNRLSDEIRDWLRQMASGLLDGVGSGDPKNTDVGVLVYKDLSSEEIESLAAKAKLPPRRAVIQVKTVPLFTLTYRERPQHLVGNLFHFQNP